MLYIFMIENKSHERLSMHKISDKTMETLIGTTIRKPIKATATKRSNDVPARLHVARERRARESLRQSRAVRVQPTGVLA